MNKIFLDKNGFTISESEFDLTKGHKSIDIEAPKEDLTYRAKVEEIERNYSTAMKLLTGRYSEEEQKTWSTQIAEAEAYKADTSSEIPMLNEIADGIDIDVLADKIIDKANYLKVESGKLLAIKNRELKALKDAVN